MSPCCHIKNQTPDFAIKGLVPLRYQASTYCVWGVCECVCVWVCVCEGVCVCMIVLQYSKLLCHCVLILGIKPQTLRSKVLFHYDTNQQLLCVSEWGCVCVSVCVIVLQSQVVQCCELPTKHCVVMVTALWGGRMERGRWWKCFPDQMYRTFISLGIVSSVTVYIYCYQSNNWVLTRKVISCYSVLSIYRSLSLLRTLM